MKNGKSIDRQKKAGFVIRSNSQKGATILAMCSSIFKTKMMEGSSSIGSLSERFLQPRNRELEKSERENNKLLGLKPSNRLYMAVVL